MIFEVHGWLFKSLSLIKSWVKNSVSSECPSLTKLSLIELEKRMSMWNKDTDFSNHDLIEVEFSKIT